MDNDAAKRDNFRHFEEQGEFTVRSHVSGGRYPHAILGNAIEWLAAKDHERSLREEVASRRSECRERAALIAAIVAAIAATIAAIPVIAAWV